MSLVLERARQSCPGILSLSRSRTFLQEAATHLLTLAEGEDSYLRVVDFCAESIARGGRAESEAGQLAKHQWRRRGQRSGGADETR